MTNLVHASTYETSTSSLRPEQQPNQQPTPPRQQEETYERSFLRRAWDKVESILVPDRESSPPYYAEESPLPFYDSDVDLDDDDDADDEDMADDVASYHLSEHYQLHPYHMLGGHRRRKSTASQELIRPTRRSTRQRYENWTADFDVSRQRDEKSPVKDLIAGWAMGEVGPWFD